MTKIFLDFLDQKNFLNRLKTLKNTILAYRLMRKTIFLILDFIAKNCPSDNLSV